MWNAFYYVLQFNFKLANVGGSVNRTADFLSKVLKEIRLKIWEHIQRTSIEMTTSSSDVASLLKNNSSSSTQTKERIKRADSRSHGTIPVSRERLGSKWCKILIENYCQRIHNDRREEHVVLHEWNQSNCANRSRTTHRISTSEFIAEDFRPILWWSATDNR